MNDEVVNATPFTRPQANSGSANTGSKKSSTYTIKEIYYTLQGEGVHTGRAAVFCRFSGCNLWSGVESGRDVAICKFCDTDFVGTDGQYGGRYSCIELAEAAKNVWDSNAYGNAAKPYVVCTGGEPLLQLDDEAIEAFHAAGFELAIETNGTIRPPDLIDWVTVSPKVGSELIAKTGDELKLVFPQIGGDPSNYEHLDFNNFILQPMDGPKAKENTEAAISYCLKNPKWKLGLQTHKLVGLP